MAKPPTAMKGSTIQSWSTASDQTSPGVSVSARATAAKAVESAGNIASERSALSSAQLSLARRQPVEMRDMPEAYSRVADRTQLGSGIRELQMPLSAGGGMRCRMPGLVETELAPAGHLHRGHEAEPLVGYRPGELDSLALQLVNGRRDIVTH